MNTNVLLITPYTFNNHGGVQNQVNLMQEYLDEHKLFDVKVFAHGKDPSLENNKIFNIPFNSSISSVMLFPGKKLLHEYLDWADVVHVHEPFVPLIFWRLPKNKKYDSYVRSIDSLMTECGLSDGLCAYYSPNHH